MDDELRAALSWIDEVYPAKTPDGGGAIFIMTWEQWNIIRRAMGLREHTGIGRSSMPYKVVKDRRR